jgi:PPOX class probable F420-dependent enzyme
MGLSMTARSILTPIEQAFVQRQRVARLATADEGGHPTLIPICYAFDGHVFYTPLDEKPKSIPVTQLKRVRNIEARHEAALLIDQYSDDWSQLGYVLIHAHAELLYPPAERHNQALQLLRARYIQYQTMNLEQNALIVLTPERITSWGVAVSL